MARSPIAGPVGGQPRIGPAVDEIAPDFRCFRFQPHTAFYTDNPALVVISAVLHEAP
jgi:plasmid stabilization system protein ParE